MTRREQVFSLIKVQVGSSEKPAPPDTQQFLQKEPNLVRERLLAN